MTGGPRSAQQPPTLAADAATGESRSGQMPQTARAAPAGASEDDSTMLTTEALLREGSSDGANASSGPRAGEGDRPEPASSPTGSSLRLFGSSAFFRLWLAQVASSLGDWVGIVAITALSYRIGGTAATGFTLAARFVPGFFLAPLAGVLVDRADRKRVMVGCDLVRALLLCSIPLSSHTWQLVAVSFFLELATLLWSPAKDASVPNIVPASAIPTVGSLSMVAAYGTFPIAAVLSAALFKLTEVLGRTSWLSFLQGNREAVAIGFDALTFLVSALLISSLPLRASAAASRRSAASNRSAFAEMREGLRFIRVSPVVRAVMVGMGTGLVGGGLVIPLGRAFAARVLGAGDAGYGLLLSALGSGAAAGVIGIVSVQRRLPRERVFCAAVFGGGISLLGTAVMSTLTAAAWLVALFGVCAGGSFVLGTTILQTDVDDTLRGRIFAAFYAVVRLALTVPLVLGPFLSAALDRLVRRRVGPSERVRALGTTWFVPGVRVTLVAGGAVIVVAGVLATRALRLDRPAVTR